MVLTLPNIDSIREKFLLSNLRKSPLEINPLYSMVIDYRTALQPARIYSFSTESTEPKTTQLFGVVLS